jgi:hypothetical protein
MTTGNPWGLTPKEAEAMDAMCATGNHKAAARRLDCALTTLDERVKIAGRKMNATPGDRLRKYIVWSIYRRFGAVEEVKS